MMSVVDVIAIAGLDDRGRQGKRKIKDGPGRLRAVAQRNGPARWGKRDWVNWFDLECVRAVCSSLRGYLTTGAYAHHDEPIHD